jgi:hypothetical protein
VFGCVGIRNWKPNSIPIGIPSTPVRPVSIRSHTSLNWSAFPCIVSLAIPFHRQASELRRPLLPPASCPVLRRRQRATPPLQSPSSRVTLPSLCRRAARAPPLPLPASCWHAVPSLAGELRRPYLPLSVGLRDTLPFPSSTAGCQRWGRSPPPLLLLRRGKVRSGVLYPRYRRCSLLRRDLGSCGSSQWGRALPMGWSRQRWCRGQGRGCRGQGKKMGRRGVDSQFQVEHIQTRIGFISPSNPM